MGHSHLWHTEGIILITLVDGQINLPEAQDLLNNSTEMMANFPDNSIYHIIDVTQVTEIVLNIMELAQLMSTPPPNLIWTVIVVPNTPISNLFRFFGTIGSKFSNTRIRFFHTQAEALTFIHDQI